MIFLSLGTHEQPFARAVSLVRPLAEAGEELLIQHGYTSPDPSFPNAIWERFLDYERMADALRASRAFVCHAGVGSVLTAFENGITPVLVPREKRFGEHVDDHQLQLARKLAERGLVVLVTGGDIVAAVERAADNRGQVVGASERLRSAVLRATTNKSNTA